MFDLLVFTATVWTYQQTQDIHIEPQAGILYLNCLYGRDLRPCDLYLEKMDPYVIVKHKSFTERTETIHSGGNNVNWNHKPWKLKVSTTDEISIIGYDKDTFSSDDIIGKCDTTVERLI